MGQISADLDGHLQTGSYQDFLDAERWLGQFLGALRETDDPEGLRQDLVAGIEQRRWVYLNDANGVKFASFESFCETPPPFGLGRNSEIVRAFLGQLMGPRQVERLTVRPAHPGVHTAEATSRQNGGRSRREEERLRAVQERAPEPVRQLRDLGILSVAQAAWFGPTNPDEDRQQAIGQFTERAQEVLQELSAAQDEASLARAKARVLEGLPIPKPSRCAAALRQVQRLNPDELDRFLEDLRVWLFHRENLLSMSSP